MTEGKSINLLKAAKELNIGIGTAVEYLVKKGFDVDSKPSSKLSPEMYGVLLKEFQGDKIVKDEAKQIVIGKIRREEGPATGTASSSPESTEEKESPADVKEILIKNASTENAQPAEDPKKEDSGSALKVVGKIDLDSLKRGKPAAKPEPKEEKPAEPEKKVEVKKEEAPVAKQEVEPKK